MATRRELLRLTGGTMAAGLFGRWPPPRATASDDLAASLPPAQRGADIAITTPHLADARHAVPIGIRIEPTEQGQRVEVVELLLQGRTFPGVARFVPVSGSGAVSLDCQVRLERSERLIVVARLSDGTSCRAFRDVAVHSG